VIYGRRDSASVPGSGFELGAAELELAHVFNVDEALRKVPGLNPRGEEGFGLRPNVGVRGLNPTRSTKITLLEDGIPLAYASYGDNASYYHPSIDRYSRVEVLKGAAMLPFGPQSIGAVINYVTPTPTEDLSGELEAAFGNRDYVDAHARLSGEGVLVDYYRKQGDGARDAMEHQIDDLNLKALFELTSAQRIILRANYFGEDSQLTYSGITDAELASFGRDYNPFENDEFQSDRYALSATHAIDLGDRAELTTSAYYAHFSRDWWRQSSSTTDGQCGAPFLADRAAGIAVDPDGCASRQGRLRDYANYGLDTRLTLEHGLFGLDNRLDAGLRFHFENQRRKQLNGSSPTADSGTLVEDNDRDTRAYSAFLQNELSIGRFTVTPGLRLESIHAQRENDLTGASGSDDLTELVWGVGATYNPSERVTLFAGIHRGFAPPRVEDLIDGSGASTEVDAEESLNLEVGLRADPMEGLHVDATYFRNDFDELTAVGSVAGGSTPLAQGQALFEGLELASTLTLESGPYLRLSYTALWTAEQSSPFRRVSDGLVVAGSAAGNRQPYAPEHLLSTTFGFARGPFDASVEVVYVDDVFSDFANTESPLVGGAGQIGRIDSYTIANLALNYRVERLRTNFFFTVKNLADETYIVDRTRGIQVGMPRLFQGGAQFSF
jgi:Fe(3+) dicitrate transport protein